VSTEDLLVSEGRAGLSRRTLIKGAAVAGAAAWTAPVLIDSLTSAAAAAACSTKPTLTFKASGAVGSTAATTTTVATSTNFTVTAGSRVVVFIATSNRVNGSATVSGLSGNMVNTASAAQLTSVTNYNNNTANRTFDFFCWTAPGLAAATGPLTVTFSGTNAPNIVSIAVYQVTGATSFTGAVGKGTSASASTANYAAAPPANNVELWGVTGGDASSTVFNWDPPVGWTENLDSFNDLATSNSGALSFEVANRTTAAQASGTFATNPVARTPDWAAIRVLCGC
jgi:hypothetical protein